MFIMLQLYKLVIWLARLVEEVAKVEVVELLRQPMTLNRDETEFVEQVKKVYFRWETALKGEEGEEEVLKFNSRFGRQLDGS